MRITVAASSLVLAVAAYPLSADEFRYRGTCDASAAVALGADHFIVADDERDVLMIYRRDKPEPEASVDVTGYLSGQIPDSKSKETDLEGAARIDHLIYWIGSHSRNKRERQRLFATTIIESEAVPTVKPLSAPPYTDLLHDLLAEPKFAALHLDKAAKKHDPEEKGAVNIEGLAATPDGHLLIGFRNPLYGMGKKSRRKAIVIPIINPRAVVERGEKPVFGNALFLNLGGRGIRSIERVGDRYLIIAGPFDSGKRDGKDFTLYAWNGKRNGDPLPLRHDFGTLNPETVFALPGGNKIQILSDDGDAKVEGRKCKSDEVPASEKSFRSITWTVP